MDSNNKEMTDLGSTRLLTLLNDIKSSLSNVDLKLHNIYTTENLTSIHNRMKEYLDKAKEMSDGLKIHQKNYPNDEKYNKINKIYKEIEEILNGAEICQISGYKKACFHKELTKLFDCYNELEYSFHSASREVSFEIGVILFCKNVRIMEDLIDKICRNNIDKSIISGDKHYKSMEDGFEWLFCHNDINSNKAVKHIDIRDRNRYLDYIKYQIMVSSKYVDHSPKSSIDIDKYYSYIEKVFDEKPFDDEKRKDTKTNLIKTFKADVTKLIGEFFSVYELLTNYRDLLFLEEEIRKGLKDNDTEKEGVAPRITKSIIDLSSVAVRVLLDRFVSFVKINDLNFGNSTFNRSWFNYSELSNSNYAGSNFKHARIENAKVKGSDISTCNLSLADGGYTDFSYSNFNYSNLTGMNLIGATLNNCEFQHALFRDTNVDSYYEGVKKILDVTNNDFDRITNLINIWSTKHNGQQSLNNIIITYRDSIDAEDFKELESEILPISILKYTDKKKAKDTINRESINLVKYLLEEHIPAELLKHAKERMNWPGIEDEVQYLGKVFFDTADLTEISAKNTQFSGVDFCHLQMERASFENSDMSNTEMYYSIARNASFTQCNINSLKCFESDFYSCNLSSAIANDIMFINCNLRNTNWDKAILIGATIADFSQFVEPAINESLENHFNLRIDECFTFAKGAYNEGDGELDPEDFNVKQDIINDISNYHLIIETIRTNKYQQSSYALSDATFTSVLADNSAFLNIMADRSTFNYSSLKNALLANCRFYLSDFIETDFRYSNITLCCMGQSCFKHANMTNAKVRYVDFSNSNMSNVLINLSELNHVLFDNSDLHEMNVSGAIIKNCAFVNCNIRGMIFSGAQFINCVFYGIKFKDIIGVHTAKFKNCFIRYCTYDLGNNSSCSGKLEPGVFFNKKRSKNE